MALIQQQVIAWKRSLGTLELKLRGVSNFYLMLCRSKALTNIRGLKRAIEDALVQAQAEKDKALQEDAENALAGFPRFRKFVMDNR